MSLDLLDMKYNIVFYINANILMNYEIAKKLVMKNILWYRKWTDNIPTYIHSLRVWEYLEKFWFSEEVCLAWLLHDIIEDWWYDEQMLINEWFSERVVELVKLCSHDKLIEDKYERWLEMINRLIISWDIEAWWIKLADISDNMLECHLMPNRDNLSNFLFKKWTVFSYYWNKYYWWTDFFNEYMERYFKQIKKYYSIINFD